MVFNGSHIATSAPDELVDTPTEVPSIFERTHERPLRRALGSKLHSDRSGFFAVTPYGFPLRYTFHGGKKSLETTLLVFTEIPRNRMFIDCSEFREENGTRTPRAGRYPEKIREHMSWGRVSPQRGRRRGNSEGAVSPGRRKLH